jgi:hypothetical protein
LVASDFKVCRTDGGLESSCEIRWARKVGILDGERIDWPGEKTRLCIRVHDVPGGQPFELHRDATPFLPILTLLGCATSTRVEIDGSVDEVALQGARAASGLVADWWGWADLGVNATAVGHHNIQSNRSVGLFFSRGLDSMSSLVSMINSGQQPDWLLGIDWIDSPLSGPDFESIFDGTRKAATDFGVPLIRLSSNARLWLDKVMPWDRSVGAFLSACALTLGDILSEAGISSAHAIQDHPQSAGHHPDLDPLWSSSKVRIIHRHDVAEGRISRARALLDSPAAIRNLKVCWESAGDGNCGVCRKCLLTQANLWLAGFPDEALGIFESALSAAAVTNTSSSSQPWNALHDEVLIAFSEVAAGTRLPAAHRRSERARKFAEDQANAWKALKAGPG